MAPRGTHAAMQFVDDCAEDEDDVSAAAAAADDEDEEEDEEEDEDEFSEPRVESLRDCRTSSTNR